MKLLVDECLSDELTKLAQRRGHAEASHIAWVGKRGWKDWELKAVIVDGDWTFVTRNSVDFRGPLDAPGSRGQYANVALHAGLICLDGPWGWISIFSSNCLKLRLMNSSATAILLTKCWKSRCRTPQTRLRYRVISSPTNDVLLLVMGSEHRQLDVPSSYLSSSDCLPVG